MRPTRRARPEGTEGASVIASRCIVDGVEHVIVALPVNEQAMAALTPAEQDVALAVALGKSNPEIARERGSSVNTVANQVQSLLRKLGVSSRTELGARLYSSSG